MDANEPRPGHAEPDADRRGGRSEEAPRGGSATTDAELEADNAVEADTLKALEDESPSG